MPSDKEKLEFVVQELLEGFTLLLRSVETLYKEEPKNDKLYHVVPVLLLCFCFLDFLKRFDYILINGKDGSEDRFHGDRYKEFLRRFIINNEEYKKHDYSFNEDDLYKTRNDVVHSLGLKEDFSGENTAIHFVAGYYLEDKEKLNSFKQIILKSNPWLKEVHVIAIGSFLKIIKCGLKAMVDEHKDLLKKKVEEKDQQQLINLNDLYDELKRTTRYYLNIPKPEEKINMGDIKPEIKEFYEKIIKGWMMGDLHTVAKKENGANFITALGCFMYTEAIGLYLPELDRNIEDSFEKNGYTNRKKRFYRCLFMLESKEYLIECDKKLKENGVKNGIYHLRHRFAHKYLPNLVTPQLIPVGVVGSHNENVLQALKKIGLSSPIVLAENSGKINKIIINNVKYIEELQKLVDFVYYQTFIEKDPIFINSMNFGYNKLFEGED